MKTTTFKKVLIANRGEIALRVIHALRELNITSVAIYAPSDQGSRAVQAADEAYPLDGIEVAQTYLDISQILNIAKQAGVDAIHPGYGFLSENAEFASACQQAGITFIGPDSQVIAQMGDKMAAKKIAEAAGVPTIPGFVGEVPQGKKLDELIQKIGLPLLIKAAAGGGGKGMRIVHDVKEVADAVDAAQREAKAYFGDGRVFLEKYLVKPRHIEVQILGDTHGHQVHLFERECSIQRRHQKIIEEAPSPSIDEDLRQEICTAALNLAKQVSYSSAGTVEFIVDQEGRFYFLEVNTRLQVEHPVTEWITGIDLVKAQIEVAQGHELPFTQKDITRRGHAIECRLYAEDPEKEFLPGEGVVGVLHEPERPGVRLDSGLQEGQKILGLFDPMLAKLSTYGATRQEALHKMESLVQDYTLLGLRHNLDFLKFVLSAEVFKSGHYHTATVTDLLPDFLTKQQEVSPAALTIAALAARSAGPNTATHSSANTKAPYPPELQGFRNS